MPDEKKEEKKDENFNFGTDPKVAQQDAIAASTQTQAPPTRKSVGKPEKAIVVETPAVTNVAETAPAPKKRGRPRKNPVQTVSNVGEQGTVTNVTPQKEPEEKDPRKIFINQCLKKAGKTALPTIESLFAGREQAISMEIGDIAVFIDKPVEKLLQELAEEWKPRNTCNLSAEVNLKNTLDVGADILNAGKVFMSIEVARIKGEKNVQCWSGRHRLAFLALAYSVKAKVPVSIMDFPDLAQACQAVIFANMNRRALALEKAEFHVLNATGGNKDMEREEMYKKSITKKSAVSNFAVFSVIYAKIHGSKLHFKISTDLTRSTGMTTINNLKGFWKKALTWDDTMSLKDFDGQLKDSCAFLNALVEHMEANKAFLVNQHLASRPMVAIGTMYRALNAADKDATKSAKVIADAIIAMGEIGSTKSDKTYNELEKSLKKELVKK
jgi:hypothetical protein